MTLQTPIWLGTKEYTAAQDRLLAAWFTMTAGVRHPNDLAITQHGAGDLTVDMASGWGAIDGTDQTNQGTYVVYNDASINVTGAPANPTTHPRIDALILKLNDSEHSSSTPADVATPVWVSGTETSGATIGNLNGAPSLATTKTFILLAYVLRTVGDTGILTAEISDQRRLIGPKIIGENGNTYRLGVDALSNLGIEQL